jgi:hypothetical protein
MEIDPPLRAACASRAFLLLLSPAKGGRAGGQGHPLKVVWKFLQGLKTSFAAQKRGKTASAGLCRGVRTLSAQVGGTNFVLPF